MNSKILRKNHSGNLETSKPLKHAASWVRQHMSWTSIEMAAGLCTVSPRDLCRHLRSNGMNISPARYERTTSEGKRVFRWDLL